MRTVVALDAIDVLMRARAIIEAGGIPDPRDGDGLYCPWCAIARAKTQLDKEHHIEGINDGPLEMARLWLGPPVDTRSLLQTESLALLNRAIAMAE